MFIIHSNGHIDILCAHNIIIQELWPVEINSTDKNILNNRINKHINTLRKALLNFPEYQIETEHGKGYRLLIPSNLTPYAP
ncbi:MAG: helix-turn-helix domain-containing protein [Bacteroides sp.]|nr:helix-turn-helix domain-containing protein [Bacteroides sp.]